MSVDCLAGGGFGERQVNALRGLVAAALLIGGCATPTARADREVALLQDARQCEAEADEQLRSTGQNDSTMRILFFRSCMALRGWQGR